MPLEDYYGLDYIEQVSNETNDIVYYELGRFIELLTKSNPNILELLYTPDDSIVLLHPVFQKIRKENFLSKQCKDSFGGYAMTQIRKAKGLNKKVLNPIDKERKGILDFCFVAHEQGAMSMRDFLELRGLDQEKCGLARIPHMNEIYGIYYGEKSYNGIVKKDSSSDVALSSIPKRKEPIAIMSYNKSEYSKYCKEYKEYWEWVDKRNNKRFENTIEHGKNYDAKNMMHTIRLLNMCEEIGLEGKLNVRRLDREHLLNIKNGKFQYDELLKIAENKISLIDQTYENSNLPDTPDYKKLNNYLIQIRKDYYAQNDFIPTHP